MNNAIEKSLKSIYRNLVNKIKEKKFIVVAFSGGLDSTLVSLASKEALGSNALIVLVINETVPKRDISDAVDIATMYDLNFQRVLVPQLDDERFISNPYNRCALCKDIIMKKVIEIARINNIQVVADGSNISDLDDYRPGLNVCEKLGIWHPLIELDLTRKTIKQILKMLEVPIWEKESSPCLSSRIPYGETITKDKLDLIDRIEERVRDLGISVVRLRLYETYSNKFVGIFQVNNNKLLLSHWKGVTENFDNIIFTIDPNGYKMGSMNKTIPLNPIQ